MARSRSTPRRSRAWRLPFAFPAFRRRTSASSAFPTGRAGARQFSRILHPKLAALGEDILADFRRRGIEGLHPHLPQLNWPRGYQPFCTWLALSNQPHRYQDLAQLNVGVHEPFVAVRLGFDTSGYAFGRLLFLISHGDLEETFTRIAEPAQLRCRVYRSAPWPEGSRAIYDSGDDFARGVRIAEREAANWFEVEESSRASRRAPSCTVESLRPS